MASPSPSSSSDSSCLILEDNEAPASPLPQEGAKPPSPALPPVPPPLPPQANGGPDPKPPASRKDPASLQAENERLFAEFVTFCAQHTADHPEVMPYLASRHQKTNPDFLASVEYRNVLGRCLTRVQARRSKIYVYINELCTVFKAHAQRRKLPIASATPAVQDGDTVAMASAASTGDTVAAAAVSTEEATPAPSDAPEGSKTRPDSRRHIRYLENLLRVYAEEIRRLQERELDLEELDREDSAYLQESRLKRRMMHIFRRLCELKDCNSLTGRVIEQRIPYRGTRYPEVNRRIERLINRNQEAFPDYADILKVVQKANVRHSLGLPKRQMESMAADAFREVGNRLQERRHLDLIYNFGSHLTDQYRPSADPALTDGDLARRLRHNREKAVQRLEEVTSQFAQLQDQSEETEWRQRKKGGRAPTTKSQTASLTGEADPGAAASAPQKGSQSPMGGRKDPVQENPQEEEDEEDEDEEEEEESSFESDMEADLAKGLESGEDDEGLPPDEEPSAAREAEADQRMDLEVMEVVLYSSVDEEEEEEEDEEEEEEEEEGEDDEKGATGAQQALLETEEVLLLDENGMPRKQKPSHPPAKRGRTLENGSSPRPGVTAVQDLNGQPPRKRGRQEHLVSDSTCIEVPSTGSSEAEDEDAQGEVVLFGSLPSTRSPAPLADSTCADSPSLGLVTSSLGSPPDQHQPEQALLLAKVCKTSVATQCDPEEIIVLSDSD